ncbi:MAG TPA: tripartite tricarboxylate transporter TctB family protein [Ramlibacter sp.]|nr:tripartite tricarboxylate transporter TctB family protein [Ramlibacter sp.]
MKIKSQKDFWAGLMFMAVGIAFGWGATNYSIGEGSRMGPGYFPLVLGCLLGAIGLFVVFESMVVETEDGEKIGKWAWKPLFYIIAANLVFGLCIGGIPKLGIPSLGMIVGIYALVFIASMASHEHKAMPVLVLGTFLAILSYVAFIWLLKLQFPVWPSFLVS